MDAYEKWRAVAGEKIEVELAGVDVSTRHIEELTATPPGVLIGRDSDLAMLAGLVAGVAAGRGSAVLVEGEPGIGKSALVRAALAGAASLGCQVFWGTGDELGQALPLQPLLDGLRVREPSSNPRRNTIVRLLRGEVTADRGTDGSAVLAEQLLALIAEQCAMQPTILVIDDLQWADQASIRLWGRLARSVRQVPLLLVGMMRPVPQRDDLLALRRAVSDAARLQLAGLTEATAAELVASLVGGEPDGKLLRLAGDAAGNPLYITELVAALTQSSTVTITGTGIATLTAGSAPSSLSAAIADRLGFVSGPVREVLRAAALLGVDFAVTDLAAWPSRWMSGCWTGSTVRRTCWSAGRPGWRLNSSRGPSPVPRLARPSTAGWPADSPTPSTVSVTGHRPSRWHTAPLSTWSSPISW
jgi:hypothetical protein